jgi:hypothetical protein
VSSRTARAIQRKAVSKIKKKNKNKAKIKTNKQKTKEKRCCTQMHNTLLE